MQKDPKRAKTGNAHAPKRKLAATFCDVTYEDDKRITCNAPNAPNAPLRFRPVRPAPPARDAIPGYRPDPAFRPVGPALSLAPPNAPFGCMNVAEVLCT